MAKIGETFGGSKFLYHSTQFNSIVFDSVWFCFIIFYYNFDLYHTNILLDLSQKGSCCHDWRRGKILTNTTKDL